MSVIGRGGKNQWFKKKNAFLFFMVFRFSYIKLKNSLKTRLHEVHCKNY